MSGYGFAGFVGGIGVAVIVGLWLVATAAGL